MDAEALLSKVRAALAALEEAAEPYGGLFPSMLDRRTGRMLGEMPPHIEGQRDGDRSPLGSNLMHDESTLLTAYGLAGAGGGGFILLFARPETQPKIKEKLKKLLNVPFNFHDLGSHIVYYAPEQNY